MKHSINQRPTSDTHKIIKHSSTLLVYRKNKECFHVFTFYFHPRNQISGKFGYPIQSSGISHAYLLEFSL